MKPVVICGPSGAGKGTLIAEILQKRPELAALQVSHTSRAPREGEIDGREYYFTDLETMRKMRDNGDFIECCEVHGKMYGSSSKSLETIMNSGKVPIMDIDVQGCFKLKEHPLTKNAIYVWIDVGEEELRRRLEGRGEKELELRLENGRRDRKIAMESGIFGITLINEDKEFSLKFLTNLIELARNK